MGIHLDYAKNYLQTGCAFVLAQRGKLGSYPFRIMSPEMRQIEQNAPVAAVNLVVANFAIHYIADFVMSHVDKYISEQVRIHYYSDREWANRLMICQGVVFNMSLFSSVTVGLNLILIRNLNSPLSPPLAASIAAITSVGLFVLRIYFTEDD